ncbi:MAG TPA: hypothetical protein VFK05_38725 [Polyangiaceae bacterium]|nr:hypothetical protein [Polyangiaceae bacterium]
MNKLYLSCVLLVPLFGCGATSDDNSASPGGGIGGAFGFAGSVSSGSNANASAGSNGSVVTGSSGSPGAGNATASGGQSSSSACSVDALPAEVQAMLTSKCATCHGAVPTTGLPSLVSYANLTAASKGDPSKTNAVVALARIQSTTTPMPPAPGTRATASEIAALQSFISQGYPKAMCATGSGGATGTAGATAASGGAAGMTGTVGTSGGAPGMDPLSAPATCTSKSSWSNGNRGSSSMNPGLSCISCHKTQGGEAPTFSIAGTVYPTGHEPDLCNSKVGSDGARIVITGADGKVLTITPNSVGNFSSMMQVKTPFQAKVTYQGRERSMLTAQSNGDCNSCHTQNGTNMAPGRITVP